MEKKFISRLFKLLAFLLPAFSLAPPLSAQQHQVAITIDDLPRGGDAPGTPATDRALTVRLLASFKAGQIPLTGFVNECHHPDEARELLKLWIEAGAELGNHTCSHLDLNTTSPSDFEADIVKGEPVTTSLLGRLPPYFRYPYLHTGATVAVRDPVEAFIKKRGYVLAPVTLDNDDYVFARVYAGRLAAQQPREAARLLASYVKYMDTICAFFEKRGVAVTGHDVKQILLIHASQLNADAMPLLLDMLHRRGYEFIPLWEALTDNAYQLPDSYAGPKGISWIHRWGMAKGLPLEWEPDPPADVMQAYQSLQ